MSGIGIVDDEEFSVYCDPPAEQQSGQGQQEPGPPGQEAGTSAPGHPQRQPLGDRTAEYWGGYYKPLVRLRAVCANTSGCMSTKTR